MNPLYRQFQAFLIGGLLVSVPLIAVSAPKGGEIIGGSGSISSNATTTSINQNSQSLVVGWDSFNVSANETVNFIQPSASAAALNQIYDQNPSQILGSINSNGRVFLSNPNGLVFGAGSIVNVGALFATSLGLDSADFMQGNYQFSAGQHGSGAIVNYGLLQAATGGSISLVGESVSNQGVILANFGQINLASGKQATVNFDGDGLINFQIDEAVIENLAGVDSAVENSGDLIASGGQIILTAEHSEAVFENSINNSGLIQATRIEQQGGLVLLSGSTGSTIHSGQIDVSSTDGKGGEVQVLGQQVGLFGEAKIDASGQSGGGVVLIGGDFQGSNPNIQNAQLTVVGPHASITADAVESGDGGRVIVWADQTTHYSGEISARGGQSTGNGGFVEVSGKGVLQYNGWVDTRAPHGEIGTLLLDPTNIEIADNSETGVTATTQVDGFGDADVDNGGGGADSTTNTISDELIEAALDGSNLTLQANDDITVSQAIDTTGNTGSGDLTLEAGDDVIINAAITNNSGDVTLTANAAGHTAVSHDGIGTVQINSNITTQGGDLTISGEGVTVAAVALNTDGVDGTSPTAGGAVSITATNGNVVMNTSSTISTLGGDDGDTGGNAANGGSVGISGDNVTVGSITTTGGGFSGAFNGNGGNGGNITITSSDGNLTVGNIIAIGGDSVNAGEDGGDAGDIDLNNTSTDGDISISNIDSTGGTGAGSDGSAGAVTIDLTGDFSLTGTQFDALSIALTGTDDDTTISGPALANTWNITGANAATLITASNTNIVGTGLNGITGGSSTNTITGTGQTYTLAASTGDAGSSNGISWTDVDTLNDSTGTVNFNTGGSVSGNVTAQTLDYSSYTQNLTLNITSDTITNDGVSGTLSGFTTVNGNSSQANEVNGTGETYLLVNSTPDSGSGSGVSWSDFQDIDDSTGTVDFNTSGSVTGTVNAQTLDYDSYASGVTIGLTGANAGSADGTGGFTSVTTISGNVAQSNTVGGSGETYLLTNAVANSGSSNGISWTNFQGVNDSTGTVDFNISGSVTGSVSAATLDFDSFTTSGVTVVLSGSNAGTATATGGFTNVSTISGNSLQTNNMGGAGQTYLLTNATANSGSSNGLSWSNFQNINDATGTVDFNVTGSVGGNVTAQILDYTDYTQDLTLNITADTITNDGVTGTLSGFNTVNANSLQTNSVTGTAETYLLANGSQNSGSGSGLSWSNFQTINDATGTVDFNTSGSVGGDVTAITLDYSSYTQDLTFNITADTITNDGVTGVLSGFTTVNGNSSQSNEVTGTGETYLLVNGDPGSGSGSGVSWTDFQDIDDSTGTVDFNTSGSVTGTLAVQTLDYDSYATGVSIGLTGANAGNADVTGNFTGVTAINGNVAQSNTMGGSGETYLLTNSVANSGTSNGINWTNFQNISDATGTVDFNVSGSLGANVTAQILDYTAFTQDLTLNVTTNAITNDGVSGILSGFSVVNANALQNNVVTGAGETYLLVDGSQDSGSSSGISWSNFQNISDGTGTVNFNTSGSVSNNVFAQTLDYSSYTQDISLNLSTGVVTNGGVSGTLSGFTAVDANPTQNNVISGIGEIYRLTGTDEGNNLVTFWTSFGTINDTGTVTMDINSFLASGVDALSGSLTTGSGAASNISGFIQTNGDQNFNGSITLAADTSLISPGAVNVAGTINGNQSLIVDAASVSFGGAIGNTAPLVNLDITSTGSDVNIANLISISGTGQFDSGSNSIILTNTGNVFGSTVSFETTGSGNVQVTDSAVLNLGTSNIAGDLTAVAILGNINDNGNLIIGGTSSFTADGFGASIFLNNTGSNFVGDVSFAGASGLLNVTIDDNSAFSINAINLTGALDVTSSGTISVDGAVTADGVTLDNNPGTGDITINADVDAGNALVTIDSAGSIIVNNAVTTTDDLDFDALNDITGTGLISGFTFTANSGTGISVNTDVTTLISNNTGTGSINVDDLGDVTFSGTNDGDITITSNDTLTVSSAITSTTGALTLIADEIDLSANISADDISLINQTSAVPIVIAGTASPGQLDITSTEIVFVNATNLTIGDNNSGDISFGGDLNPINVINVSLQTGGSVNSGGGIDIRTADLVVDAVTGVDLTVETTSSIDVDVTGTGDIDVSQDGDLSIVNATTADGDIRFIATTTGDLDVTQITASTGTVTLNSLSGDITGVGTGTHVVASELVINNAPNGVDLNTNVDSLNFQTALTSADSVLIDEVDSIAIEGAVLANSGGFTVNAVGDLTVAGLLSTDGQTDLTSSAGAIIVNDTIDSSATITLDAATTLTLNGDVTRGGGLVNLNAGEAISQGASIITANLLVVNASGIDLGGENLVGTIWLTNDTAGDIVYNSALTTDVSVRANNSFSGGNVSITTEEGMILSMDSTAVDGTFSLLAENVDADMSIEATIDANIVNLETDGELTQTAAGVITANTLNANSLRSIVLDADNLVNTVEMTATQDPVTYNSVLTSLLDFSIASQPSNVTLTADGDVTISSSIVTNTSATETVDITTLGNISINGSITSDDVTLVAGGIIDQTSRISATNLITTSVGGTTLENTGNNIEILTATNSGSGDISIVNTEFFQLGTTLGNIENSAGGFIIQQSDTRFAVNGGPTILDITGDINVTGDATLAADTITLNGGSITAANVFLPGYDQTMALSVGATGINADVIDSITAQNLTIGAADYSNTVSIDEDISLTNLSGNLNVLSDQLVQINGDVTSTGGLIMESTNADIEVNSDVDLMLAADLSASNGTITIDAELQSAESITLETFDEDLLFGTNGGSLISTGGDITLNSGNEILASGDLTLSSAMGTLSFTNSITSGGDMSLTADQLNIQRDLTSAGGMSLNSANAILIDQAVTLQSGGQMTLSEVDARSSLTLNGEGVSLGVFNMTNSTSNLAIDAGSGTLSVTGNIVAPNDISLIAADLAITPSITITATGEVTIGDSGNGTRIGVSESGLLNISLSELSSITTSQLTLQSADMTLEGDLNLTGYLIPIVIEATSFSADQTTSIALGGNLDFSTSAVDIEGGLTIDLDGLLALDGTIETTNTVNIETGLGVDMGEPSSISTTNDDITVTTLSGNVLLGLLDAGNGDVNITATGGDILNNNGVFTNVTRSLTNIRADNVTLDATDRIGTSSTDAVTLDIDSNGLITLDFGADTAFINNLQNTVIRNNGSGEVAVGLIFSNQIIGVGHNVGADSTSEQNLVDEEEYSEIEADPTLISILGSDIQILFSEDDEEDVVSTIIPGVPVMIKNRDGWEFVAPTRRQKIDNLRDNQKKGVRFIDWL